MVFKRLKGLFQKDEEAAAVDAASKAVLARAGAALRAGLAAQFSDKLVLERRRLNIADWGAWALAPWGETAGQRLALAPSSGEGKARFAGLRVDDASAALLKALARRLEDQAERILDADDVAAELFAACAAGEEGFALAEPADGLAEAARRFFEARSRRLDRPEESAELIDDESAAILDPILPRPELRGSLQERLAASVLEKDGRDPAPFFKLWDKARALYQAGLAPELEARRRAGLEQRLAENLMAAGKADQVAELLKSALEGELGFARWEQLELLLGRAELMAERPGSKKARARIGAAIVARREMVTWERASDSELESEDGLGDKAWERAGALRQRAIALCEEALEKDARAVGAALELSRLRSANDEHLVYGPGFDKAAALAPLDAAAEHGEHWLIDDLRGALWLRDAGEGELAEPGSEDARKALELFEKSAAKGRPIAALHAASLALDRGLESEDEDERERCLTLAEEGFSKLKAALPDPADAFRGAAAAAHERGASDRALATLEEGLKALPKNTDLRVAAAQLALVAEDEARARALLEEALAIDPEHPEAMLLMAQGLGEPEKETP